MPARACRKALGRGAEIWLPQSSCAWLINSHPIQLHVGDDLSRRRLTVSFRALLVLPHLLWVALWGIVAFA